ncbi:hypothetical protein AB685_20090 [Bacillus sp. LL01]|uniref:hypothetical protein n=1 Tax=Bacillus sp. LL01 TaxID=1665556 RepID=UPI00064D211A|nr:hypothetical protein [Bacillus sp. LL01]KMJ56823.1 hypothetical protein AB685_20090 [Bacillus sp. LL01]
MNEQWKGYSNQGQIPNEIFSDQPQEIDNSHYSQELEEFLTSTTTSTKRNIELHQNEYIQQLTDAKVQLNQNPLGSYYEERRVDLDAELTQELEQYLAELLDEKQ